MGTALHQTMIEHLDQLGVVSNVFVPVCEGEIAVTKANANVCVSKCFNKWDRFVFDIKQYKIIKSIEKNYDVKEFDCLHAYTLFTDGNAAMKLAEKYNKPFVVAVRNTDVNDFFAKLFYLRNRGIKIMRKASAIFFLSEAYRKTVFEKYVPSKYKDELYVKTHIIPNGIDDFWHANEPSKDFLNNKKLGDVVKLIYAGRIDKNKNILTTQKAMDILAAKGIKTSLTVVGKIADEGEFKQIMNHPNTEHLQAMPKEKLIEQYRSHDIFVMPSFTETFGLVYAEAMSQGLPVVYSKGQGFDGQFENEIVGFRCQSNDAMSVAKAIMNSIQDFKRIVQNNASNSKKFEWEKICQAYVEICQCLLEK